MSEKHPVVHSKLLDNGSIYEGVQRVILVAKEMSYKNHPHFATIRCLVMENQLPTVGQQKDPIGMSEKHLVVHSKLLNNGGIYEGVQ